MIRILGTFFAALSGLAFGSFLNVCITRWPQGESIVRPRSRCRNCERTLTWWENIPLVSWLTLHGRCRTCGAWIGWRYPIVELAIGGLWALIAWRFLDLSRFAALSQPALIREAVTAVAFALFCWLLVALAVLDAEHLWLPDWLTWPGILAGFLFSALLPAADRAPQLISWGHSPRLRAAAASLLSALLAALLILVIRWLYKLLRHHEGVGLGDAKLMALLGAWLGLEGALLAFGIGVVLGAIVALIALALPASRSDDQQTWALRKMPLGTFLSIGGIVSALWGQPLIAAYLRWAGI
ncbi:MAG TPA: prepilin peptidase [Terracidiphilus sp.]|nr:prepilin peptidase [Terracidiphilus sp.]